ncbi:hypothetical protein AAC387_Pa11g2139 [Persea americana]
MESFAFLFEGLKFGHVSREQRMGWGFAVFGGRDGEILAIHLEGSGAHKGHRMLACDIRYREAPWCHAALVLAVCAGGRLVGGPGD